MSAAAVSDGLRQALEQAVSADHRSIDRLKHAGIKVTFRVDDDEPFTLLLDRRPAAITDEQPADVELTIDRRLAEAVAAGRRSLTAAVIGGRVEHTGPVRRFLEVDPILRSLLAATGRAENGRAQGEPAGERHRSIAPDLLAIEARGLSKRFGRDEVLKRIDLGIPEGVIAVVLGPSGTGKSVLLQHVIGIMRPDEGDVRIRGRSLGAMDRKALDELRRGIGVMFQDGALFSDMSVYDNVAFPLRQHTDLTDAEVHEVVEEQLASVGLADAATRRPSELSGGMRKRAGLARALALNPGIVLCDEPDSGLDPVRTSLLADLLMAQHDEHGGTMVVVTHNVMLAKQIADHMSVLWRGVVVQSGVAEDILGSDDPFIRQFLHGEPRGPLGMES